MSLRGAPVLVPLDAVEGGACANGYCSVPTANEQASSDSSAQQATVEVSAEQATGPAGISRCQPEGSPGEDK